MAVNEAQESLQAGREHMDSAPPPDRGRWRGPGARIVTGVNVVASILLAGVLMILVHYLAQRHYQRWDVATSDYYKLSEKTLSLLNSLDAEVSVFVFFRKHHEAYDEIRNLLAEYRYEADRVSTLRFKVEFVDPDRDLARTRDLARKYDISEPNMIVFECGSRRKYLGEKDVMEYQYRLVGQAARKERVSFRGEQAFSSAMQSVTQASRPVVYFLTGHGERNIEDYDRNAGYSVVARAMRQDNMEVRPLFLAGEKGVPDDCSVLVIAGPDRKLSSAELESLKHYLARSGRLCVFLDPAVTTGLEALLESWGLQLARDVVVDPTQTFTGRELMIAEYGDHPITRKLHGVATMFYMPRSVDARESADPVDDMPADKPSIKVLASTSKNGWAEYNLEQSPAKFDPEVDRQGPVPVAVAVEKGTVSGIEVQIRPSRLVVVGDSSFLSNGAMAQGVGGTQDFFLSAVNWLAEREALMAISPKPPDVIRLEMSQTQLRVAGFLLVGAIPILVSIVGLLVWAHRRR